jgi:hypothetical protein
VINSSTLDHLAQSRRWVAWRNELRGEKPTKIPYAPGGRRAKADDPATWGTRSEAEARARRIVNGQGGGVGIELGDIGADQYLAGIDLDSCMSNGTIAPWAAAILELLDSYAEISPSGSGLKLFCYIETVDVRWFLDLIAVEQDGWGCRRDVPGEDARDHGPAVEFYAALRYFAVTDNRWPAAPDRIRLLDRALLESLAKLIPPRRAKAGSRRNGDHHGDQSRSAVAFRKGAALRLAGKTFEEMCEALRADPETAEWCRSKGDANGGRELRRIWDRAAAPSVGVTLDDFYAFMPMHNYIFAPTCAFWPGASVNSRIPPIKLTDKSGQPLRDKEEKQVTLSAAAWLDRYKPVEQMTWVPGLPMVIHDKLVLEGGWIDRDGVTCFNLYRPPTITRGDAAKAGKWIDHLRYIYPEEADHILDWLAHRVQRPGEKINHALVLGGLQGIGKDTVLEPVKYGIGAWNFSEVSPQQILGRFNGFLKSVILRISEARDLGEFDRFAFYDHMKAYTAAPPDVLRVDEKNLREHSIFNCCGIVVTTNHKTNGIHLPADDRRHFVAWSYRTKEDERFQGTYWNDLWTYYENGGREHVAAYLLQRDITGFNPKAPPPKTPAFWAIADANRPPEDAELADLLDAIGTPAALPLSRIIDMAEGYFAEWIKDRKNRRIIPHRMESCGYVPVRNPDAEDGRWKIFGRRHTVYARTELSLRDQIIAARALA